MTAKNKIYGQHVAVNSGSESEWGLDSFPAKYANCSAMPVDQIFMAVPIGRNDFTKSTAEQSIEFPVFTEASAV